MCPEMLRAFRPLFLFISFWLCLLVAWRQFAAASAQGEQASITPAPPLTGRNEAAGNGRIAYATVHRRGEYHLYLINPDGSGHFEFPGDGGRGRRPAWSPDGTKLAFERSSDIFVINADGSGLKQLTTDRSNNTMPSWSPDGARLAFLKSNDLHTMKADGTEVRKITSLSVFFYDLAWSPDGAKLLFIQSFRLKTCNPDGGSIADVLQQNFNVTSASWSPDGGKIVFTTGDRFPGGGAIRLVNADGSGLAQLTNGPADHTPVFAPDGSKIAFVHGTELDVMNTDGTGQMKLPDTNIGPAVSVGDGATVEPGLSWQRVPDAAPPAFVISGRVTDNSGQGPAGKVELRGARTAMARTDRNGYFSFGNLAAGGDYTVALSPVFFTPALSATFASLSADQRADFVAQPIRHTISGRITDSANAGMRGVAVGFHDLTSPDSYPTAVTDESGFYRLTGLLPRDGSESQVFSVAPEALFAFFQPFKFDVPRLTEDLTVNFTGTRRSIALNGRVVDAEGRGISVVTVTLGGARSRTATSDADGRFDLSTVPGGLDYTVTPAKAGLAFAPARRNFTLLSLDNTMTFRSGVSLLTLVSSANFTPGPVATEGLVTAFGANLAAFTETARSGLGETRLGGVSVEIESERGSRGNASLTFVSPTQLNLMLYFLSEPGEWLFTVTSTTTNRVVAAGAVEFARVAPALFAANSNGQGVAAAVALRVTADNRQTFEPVARFDAPQRQFVAVPLDLGPTGEQLFLVLFGLGIHNRSALDAVKCQVGGVNAPVTFAGRAPNFLALDQVNVRLPRELAGRGEVEVVLTADGRESNAVKINVK